MSLLHPTVGVVVTSLEVASLNPASQPQPLNNTPALPHNWWGGGGGENYVDAEYWRMLILKYCCSMMWVVVSGGD